MKKTSSPPPFFSRILFITMALTFLGIQAHAQRTFLSNYQVFDKGIRINGDNNYGNTEALSLHPTVTFELDAPGVIGGRFGITTDGLVGIGNNKPIFALDVAHSGSSGWVTQFLNKTSSSGIHLGGREIGGIKHGIIGSFAKTPLILNPDGGNIGIGNATNPIAPLSFSGEYGPKISLLSFGANGDDAMYGFSVSDLELEYHVSSDLVSHVFYRDHTNFSYDDIEELGPVDPGKVELMRINGNGNVGIGMRNGVAPTERLEVAGNIKATGGIVEIIPYTGEGNELHGKRALAFVAKDDDTQIRIENGVLSLHPNVLLELDTEGNHGGRFKVDKEGNVGIGMDKGVAPTERLQVAGNIKATGKIIADGGIGAIGDIDINPGTDKKVTIANSLIIDPPKENGATLRLKGDMEIGSKSEGTAKLFRTWERGMKVYMGEGAINRLGDSDSEENRDYTLWVSKGIVSEDYVMATVDKWADHVFDSEYELPSLEELSHFVRTNKHLPNIPSEVEVQQNGYSLKEVDLGLLQNLEELTLHTLAQEEKITALEGQLEQLKMALSQLLQKDED